MLVDDFKAHVFLSCGLQKGSDEIEIARQILKKARPPLMTIIYGTDIQKY